MQLDLLGVPLRLQRSVMSQDFVNHGQHVAGTLGVVSGRVFGFLKRKKDRESFRANRKESFSLSRMAC